MTTALLIWAIAATVLAILGWIGFYGAQDQRDQAIRERNQARLAQHPVGRGWLG